MNRLFSFIVLLLITSLTATSLAQSDCPLLVEFALQSTDEFCKDTQRNEACFGHVNLAAEGQPDAPNFEFVEVGDIVDVATIRTLRLSTLDTSAGAWGVVLMRVQANLPDSLPGQSITFMLFGDTEIRNAASSVAEQNIPTVEAIISSSLNANVRVGPNSTMGVLASIVPGTTVTANGISPDSQWIRIIIPDSDSSQSGWISTQLIATSGDFGTLQVVEPGQPQFGPMQAFYLSTGISEPACNEMPDNGLLVQTPKGVGEINLLVNEVEISMGSTVFMSAPRDDDVPQDKAINVNSMNVKTIEGTAISRVNGTKRVALGGSQFEVIYDDNGEIEDISLPSRLEMDEIDELPYELLEREIEIEEGLTDEELDLLVTYDDLFDFVDIDDTEALLDYLDEFGDDELLTFLQEDLEIDYFDGDMSAYLEDELGFEVDGFYGYGDEYYDDDYDDDYDLGDDDYSDDGYYDEDYNYDNNYDDYEYNDSGDDYDYDDSGDDYDDYDDGGGDDYYD